MCLLTRVYPVFGLFHLTSNHFLKVELCLQKAESTSPVLLSLSVCCCAERDKSGVGETPVQCEAIRNSYGGRNSNLVFDGFTTVLKL